MLLELTNELSKNCDRDNNTDIICIGFAKKH